MKTVGVDVGGTSVRAGVVDSRGQVLDTARGLTPPGETALEDVICSVVGTLAERHRVEAVGLAVAGFVAADRRTVLFAPHLPWRGAPVAARIASRLGLPVVLEHDANAAAVAEHRYGALRGARAGLMVALGTGIGGALLIEGEVYRGAHGVAPELGHLRLVPDGRPCPCGKSGCWERYCSGTALAATALDLLASATPPHPADTAPDRLAGAGSDRPADAGPDGVAGSGRPTDTGPDRVAGVGWDGPADSGPDRVAGSGLGRVVGAGRGSLAGSASDRAAGAASGRVEGSGSGRPVGGGSGGLGAEEVRSASQARASILAAGVVGDPGALTGRKVAAAAREGDSVARRAVAELAYWLGEGLALAADVYDPDVIVIGGGVSESAELFLDDARAHYATAVTGAGHRPLARIRPAQLGDDAGLIGAAILAADLPADARRRPDDQII